LVEKDEVVQVHFTLEGEGLRAHKFYYGYKVYMKSYMANYKVTMFHVLLKLCQAHHQKIVRMHNPAHVNDTTLG
jgi:hypothetical protein